MSPAPAPGTSYPFIFTDESGVVTTSATQPFYGLGMLKLYDPGPWVDDLAILLDKYIASVSKAGSRRAKATYEFHFSKITASTMPFYEELVDYFASRDDGYFCALIIDKKQPDIDPIKVCGTPWDALITYSQTLLRTNIKDEERAAIVSDYYQKPRKSPKYFERELVAGLGAKVTNVVMMDSAASTILQMVDVLLGCVMFHYKIPALAVVDAEKKALADRLAKAYGVASLAKAFTKNKPNYFSVWPFKPKAPPGGFAAGP